MKKTLLLGILMAGILIANPAYSATAKNVKSVKSVKTPVAMKSQSVKSVQQVQIPQGTAVPISFSQSVNSNQVTAGKALPIIVMEDVYVGNTKVFSKNTTGSARVVEAKSSGKFGKAGVLAVDGANVLDVNGNTHKLQFNVAEQGLSRKKSAIILTVCTLIPFGLWRKGEPAYVNTSNVYKSVTID